MAIDQAKVKAFWDSRAKKLNGLRFESIANLEEDPANLELKIRLETEKVFKYLGSVSRKTVVDVGAGVGQWSLRFLERDASHVTAVEYSRDLARIGREECERRGFHNIKFVVSPAEDFKSDTKFDVIFVSGLFVYMNDDQAEKFASIIPGLCHSDSTILLRDGTAVGARYEINDRQSEHLKAMYSATYRTRREYLDLFRRFGLRLSRDENMFDEDCPLNKYPETRLRVYQFQVG